MMMMMMWMRRKSGQLVWSILAINALLLGVSGTAMAADLDTSIEQGFGKLIRYGRWTAALILVAMFLLAWAERSQNSDNPHEVTKGTKKMILTGVGFVVVIGYQLVLSGLVNWFEIDPSSIPTFLWQ